MKINKFLLLICMIFFVKVSWAETGLSKCQREWIQKSYEICLADVARCNANPLNAGSCGTCKPVWACTKARGSICSNYKADWVGEPYIDNGYYWYEDNCKEPDVDAPPPIDPLTDPKNTVKLPQCSN